MKVDRRAETLSHSPERLKNNWIKIEEADGWRHEMERR